MSVTMDDSIKRWTAKRKTALVVEIIQGKTTVAEASRAYDLSPSEIEGWVDDAKRGMEDALRANPLEIREQYEKQLKDLQEAYGEAMLESTVKCGAIMQPFRFRTKVSTPDAIARTWRAGCHRELWFGFAA